MDLANYSKSLSQMITHELFRDCNMACLNDQTGNPEKSCVENCASKGSQFLSVFDKVMKSEISKLQELSRIQ